MPQELNVLRCYSCDTFQVHIVKKAKKWECKICNEKQSIKKVYAQGSGKDCRLHVQKLNAMRMGRDQDVHEAVATSLEVDGIDQPPSPSPRPLDQDGAIGKWDQFLDGPAEGAELRSDDSDEDLTSVGRRRPPPARRGRGKARGRKVTEIERGVNYGKWGEFVDETPYCAESEPTMKNDFSEGSVPDIHCRSRAEGNGMRSLVDVPRLPPRNTLQEYVSSPSCRSTRPERELEDNGAGRKRQRGKWDEFLDDSENSQECNPSQNEAIVNENVNSSNYVMQAAAQPSSPFTVNLYNDDDLDEILGF